MAWDFTKDRPIYTQLAEQIKNQIFAGKRNLGDRLPPVRDLAMDAGVNPNTMQRALAQLEQEQIIYTERTNGRFITEDKTMLDKQKKETARLQMNDFLEKMAAIGYDRKATLQLLTTLTKDGE